LAPVRLVAAAIVWFAVTRVSAQEDVDWSGSWNAGPTQVNVTVESWGPDCPERPSSATNAGGGAVRIAEEGDHLVIYGRETLRTNGCWSENRALRVRSSSYSDGNWNTQCATPQNDSRRETGRYSLRSAGPDQLTFSERSEFDWQLNESHCEFTMTRRQTFTRVTGRPAQPAAPACEPGAPARLRLSPRDETIEPGDRVSFRAVVVDDDACAVRDSRITWTLERPEGRTAVFANGVFIAAPSAAEGEGDFVVVARSGSLEERAVVHVRPLDLSDVMAQRTGGGIVQAPDEEAIATGAAGVSAETVGEERGIPLYAWIGAGAGLVLFAIGALLLLLRKKPAPAAVAPAPPPKSDSIAVASSRRVAYQICPVCNREYDDPKLGFCPVDGAELKPPGEESAGQPLICPTCRRGYAPGSRICARDQTELVPYSVFIEQSKHTEEADRRICPQCGTGYGATVRFCGKDGAELVRVN
jgi:hypothetical protein